MKNFRILPAAALALSALVFTSCENNRFEVSGQIDGADGKTLVLERLDFRGEWMAVDSVNTGSDGAYSLSFPAPEYPQVYRLGMQGRYVYFPIDSIERIQLNSVVKDFDRQFSLAGSPDAVRMMDFEKDACRVEDMGNPDSTAAFRKKVYERYLRDDKGSAVSYYILTRRIGDDYLIDYTDPLYSAVANTYQTHRPSDPRTAALVERAKAGQVERRRRAGHARVVEAEEIALIDVELKDKNGKDVKLSGMVGKGKPVVLAFGGMTLQGAPALNRELKQLYDAGLADVFQVCVDADQLEWKTAAEPLPWTVVYDPAGTGSRNLLNYNVRSLPMFYIYDRNGELHRESTADVTALRRILSGL